MLIIYIDEDENGHCYYELSNNLFEETYYIINVALNQMLEAIVAIFGCSLLTGTPSYNNCSLKILINVYFYQVAK